MTTRIQQQFQPSRFGLDVHEEDELAVQFPLGSLPRWLSRVDNQRDRKGMLKNWVVELKHQKASKIKKGTAAFALPTSLPDPTKVVVQTDVDDHAPTSLAVECRSIVAAAADEPEMEDHTVETKMRQLAMQTDYLIHHLPPVYAKLIRPVTNITGAQSDRSSLHGHLQMNRLSKPVETMLPKLRRGDPVERLVMNASELTKDGIYSLIDRGFVPPDADFTELLAPDIARAKSSGPDRVMTASDRPFLRHFKTKVHRPEAKLDKPGHPIPVTGLYEPALRLVRSQSTPASAPLPPLRLLPEVEESHRHHKCPPTPPATFQQQPNDWAASNSASFHDLLVPDTTIPENLRAHTDHGAVLPVKDGKVHTESPAYEPFVKACGPKWDAVKWMLEKIERLLTEYAVPFAEIKWAEVQRLADPLTSGPIRRDHLLACLVNEFEVRNLISAFGRRYRGIDGLNAAAAKIQATWRMSVRRRLHFWYLERLWATRILAKHWKLRRIRRTIHEKIRIQYESVHLKRFHRLLATFGRHEGQIMAHRRLVVTLVPSKHPGDLKAFADVAIGRALMLADPHIDAIFVTPLIDEDRLTYFRQMMGANNVSLAFASELLAAFSYRLLLDSMHFPA
ncbi:hypothetical protein HK104_002198 [Borealophlyctis nickersoniae]|nr:hypothetical protein HK104_002198 [Borealophlyctis nickersoniae]